jgi:hypothetical protein
MLGAGATGHTGAATPGPMSAATSQQQRSSSAGLNSNSAASRPPAASPSLSQARLPPIFDFSQLTAPHTLAHKICEPGLP